MRDVDVRVAILNWLGSRHAGEIDTRIVEEMGIWSGSVRVDVAVINGEMQGFEIKSARDNLNRLPFQAEIYSQVFDRVTLVTAQNHAVKAEIIIPTWWGISHAVVTRESSVKIVPKRKAKLNPSIQPIQLARLLWRDEAIIVLDRHGLAKGYRSKSSDVLVDRLATELPIGVLKTEVRSVLKTRIGWLRNHMPGDCDMPIDAYCDPVS